MEKSRLYKESAEISTEVIIEHLRSNRDTIINDLLENDSTLMAFLEVHFDTIAISSVKREFLKRDLVELKNSSLDLVHYSSLIKEIKETGNSVSIEGHSLFHLELKVIFEKYGF